MSKVTLTLAQVNEDLENGFTRKQMADKYDISVGALTKAMKKAGLGGKRAKYSAVLIDMGEPTCINRNCEQASVTTENITTESVVNQG